MQIIKIAATIIAINIGPTCNIFKIIIDAKTMNPIIIPIALVSIIHPYLRVLIITPITTVAIPTKIA